ncbi:hypothetical protein G6F68_014076 [Rhizopus microsporus]|nr:hypothetical protein G6F24_016121 [Rhizopus arrhizus]KAG1247737.1 hypothetical protein G6F68_014076 [Rhizopus microsporus]
MPLWRPYLRYLTSGIADLANAGSRMAGSVTAALYLERFLEDGQRWAHLDVYAWNDGERPGRPAGGEALALILTIGATISILGTNSNTMMMGPRFLCIRASIPRPRRSCARA